MTRLQKSTTWEIFKGVSIATLSATMVWFGSAFKGFLDEWHSVNYINNQQTIDITTLKQNYGVLNEKHENIDKRVVRLEAILPERIKVKTTR